MTSVVAKIVVSLKGHVVYQANMNLCHIRLKHLFIIVCQIKGAMVMSEKWSNCTSR